MKPPEKRAGMTAPRILYYRRRVLLAVLERDGGRTGKIRLQKLLFLFTRGQEQPSYHFLPYKYGCYSFQAEQDAQVLVARHGMLTATARGYSLNEKHVRKEHFQLTKADQERLENVFRQYGHLRDNELIYETYEQYPWYAIHSELLGKPRFAGLRERVERERPRADGENPVLYTTGYEGDSIECYMTRLMENCVSALLDVRHNPFSMKYGFSRKQLQHIAGECKIRYLSVPELGIEKDQRRSLASRADYRALFAQYRKSLAHREEGLRRIEKALLEHSRVALTCFEKSHEMCHRGMLAREIHKRCGVLVKHL